MPIVSQWTEGETSIDEASSPVSICRNVVSDQGILPDPKKVQSIKNWPSPSPLRSYSHF